MFLGKRFSTHGFVEAKESPLTSGREEGGLFDAFHMGQMEGSFRNSL